MMRARMGHRGGFWLRHAVLLCALLCVTVSSAQTLSTEVKAFVSVDAPVVALTHARVIDGTGGPVREDQTLVISGGRIQALGAAPAIPAGAKMMDLSGYTVIPGLVGMHDHLFSSNARLPSPRRCPSSSSSSRADRRSTSVCSRP